MIIDVVSVSLFIRGSNDSLNMLKDNRLILGLLEGDHHYWIFSFCKIEKVLNLNFDSHFSVEEEGKVSNYFSLLAL